MPLVVVLRHRVDREQLGASIVPLDPLAAADAIVDVLERGRGAYRESLARAAGDKLKHLVIYRSASDALAAGFAPREGGRKARAV